MYIFRKKVRKTIGVALYYIMENQIVKYQIAIVGGYIDKWCQRTDMDKRKGEHNEV